MRLLVSAALVAGLTLLGAKDGASRPHPQIPNHAHTHDSNHARTHPRRAPTETDDFDGMMYLMHFGYLSPHIADGRTRMDGGVLKSAVMEFQRMAHVPVTGEIDNKTLRMMNKPRCGISDVDEGTVGQRNKRYNLKAKWNKKDITYRITRYTNDLSQAQVDSEIARAFRFWSSASGLTFTQKRVGAVDIEIQFGSSSHGDSYPFDGTGGTLAHAFYPSRDPYYTLAGDAHFDDAETWTIDSHTGQNLLYVAVHELGHSLGLGHSDVVGAVMWPWSTSYDPHLALARDDIDAIQTLYGTPENVLATKTESSTGSTTTTTVKATTKYATTTATPTTSTDVTTSAPPVCSVTIDAMTSAVDGFTYAFVGSKLYRLNSWGNGVVSGFPKAITDVFRTSRGEELASGVDAALTFYALTKRGRWRLETHLFKGNKVWKYTASHSGRMRIHRGYPRPIRHEWGIKTDRFDAVFTWAGDGGIYFIRGDILWRHDGYRGIQKQYPIKLSQHPAFGSIPRFQAALNWPRNRKNYFFVGYDYYRYTHTQDNSSVLEGPFSSAKAWLGCKD